MDKNVQLHRIMKKSKLNIASKLLIPLDCATGVLQSCQITIMSK